MISHWLGWLALVFCLPLLARLVDKDFWRQVRRWSGGIIHRRLGVLMLILAVIHGVILMSRGITVSTVSGILALLGGLAVAMSYVCRKRLKAKWLWLHRMGTVLFVILLIVHLVIVLI